MKIKTGEILKTNEIQPKLSGEEIHNHKYTNKLIHESSPYLLQHAHNPVNWFPWGTEALEKAKAENKMLIISIGYAACHWCHVMEHESFEDVEVAKIMNDHFVAVKVDREERPDVDQVYMNAAYLISGSGGWPLNALALPDGRPFFAGTYYPKKDWMKVLIYFVDFQSKSPDILVEEAEKITQGIRSIEHISLNNEAKPITLDELHDIFNTWKPSIDFVKGSGKRAPKFPMPSNWEFLLNYHFLGQSQDALKAVTTTLDNMASGGIYDQIGGGFSRYSTDVDWLVPHFEKMLYDNAQLVSLYSHAFQLTKSPLYKQVVYETLGFIARELTSAEGGFYASLDADSEGEEGKFYVWTKKEIDTVLCDDSLIFSDYYNCSSDGNWEDGKNILHRKKSINEIAQKHNCSVDEVRKIVENGKSALLKVRSRRISPGLDDKILTSWNALMLKAYADAYRTFGEEDFLQAAIKNAEFIYKNAIAEDFGMTRNYKNEKSTIPALLDDYAFTISGFISLYQASFNEKWLFRAKSLADYTIEHFFDSESGMFFYTHNQYSVLIARKMEISDNVIPASNSEMAGNLFTLGLYFDLEEYVQKAKQMLKNVHNEITRNISYYANWGIVAIRFIQQPFEVAIVGSSWEKIRKTLDENYLPHIILLGGKEEGSLDLLQNKLIQGQTTIYVCRNKTCKQPVTDAVEAIKQLI
jgi:uncharacterized protein YyaL (SSP411 family)